MPDPITITDLNQVGRANAPDPNLPRVYVTYNADFSAASDITLDFTILNQSQQFGVARSIFVDNSSNPNEIEVSVSGSDDFFTIPAYAEGVFKLNANERSRISFVTDGGATDRVTITVYNWEVSPSVWYRYGAFNLDGALKVYGTMADGDDISLEANNSPMYIGGIDRATGLFHGIAVDATGNLQVDILSLPSVAINNLPAQQGAYTDRSIANLSGASEQLMAVNANRRVLVISNVSANPIAVNLTGGAAALATAGSINIAAGSTLTIDQFPPTTAINIIGTANDDVTAYEG